MAAKKKDFTQETAPVYSTIIGNADPRLFEQEEPDERDVQEAQEALQTQGKRGYKLQRINMGFTPTNLDFIRTMARAKGMTQTQLVNHILDKYREATGDRYDKIKELLGDL